MRTLMMGLLLSTALPAFADTFELDTDVTAALITGDGGIVTYTSELALTPGRHTLIAFVPNNRYSNGPIATRIGDPASVRIVAQSATTDYARPLRHEPSPAEKAAEDALNTALAAQRAFEQTYEAKQAELNAAKTQLKLLQVTAETGFGTPDNGFTAEQLISVAAALADTTKSATIAHAAAKTELATMATQRSDLAKDVEHARNILNSVTPDGHADLIQVTTQIEVTSAQTATVELDNLEEASWAPTYTAELTQDGDKGTLELHRKAWVSVGNAGEKPLDGWDAVDITLSTANLRDDTDTFIPRSDIKTLMDENRLRKTRTVSGASYDRAESLEEPSVASMEIVEETSNASSFAGQTLLFTIGGKSNIDWTTDIASFNIDTLTFDLDLYAMANAARDETAFLYADLKNDTGGVLLAGPVRLHRDGTLIGQTSLPQLVPNQDEPIGLGPLYGIQIKRDTLSVEEGDSGFITSKSEINREYRTTLISSLSYDMPTKLLDVIPTSENEDLVIRMNASPRPSEDNRDGKRGVLVWDMDLGAGDSETVTFGYQMKWPSGQIPISK